MASSRIGDDIDRLGARARQDAGRLNDDLGREAQRLFDKGREVLPEFARHAADRANELVGERLERLRAQGSDAADLAGEGLENARVYVVERVQERPLTTTFAALGVGFLLGVMLAGSRR